MDVTLNLFFGGGALFFALQPENAVIADSNPELINMYRQVADHVDNVISYLEKYQNTSEMFLFCTQFRLGDFAQGRSCRKDDLSQPDMLQWTLSCQ